MASSLENVPILFFDAAGHIIFTYFSTSNLKVRSVKRCFIFSEETLATL